MLLLVSCGKAIAEGISGSVELTYSNARTRFEDSAGLSTSTETGSFLQRYNLTLDKRLYPNLSLLAGGLFDRRATTLKTGETEIDSTATRIRPFASLTLRSPLYLAEAAYSRSEDELEVSGAPSATTVRETYSSTLHWRPDGFPDLKLQFFRTNTFDRDRVVQDSTDDQYQLTSEYRPVSSLFLRYQATLRRNEDRVQDLTIDEIGHDGRIAYADWWWRRRVSVSSDYRYTRAETEIATGGAGEVRFALAPLTGLSAIDDTPESGALDPNPALIDGDLATGTGIDLGLPPPGGDPRPRNMGLQFAVDTQVNTLLVWVDRELPAGIGNAFSWTIYTSADGENWELRQTVAPADFGPFQNRFEVRFADLVVRFIKVVVSPLSAGVPFASDFPTIAVTELQAVLRRPAAEVAGRQARDTHLYNLGVRTRILQAPSLHYELTYSLAKAAPAPRRDTLSNGLAFSHQFTRVFSGTARVAREDGREAEGTRTAYLYNAAATAVPLPTLRHSLVFSGRRETVAGGTTDTKSVSLFNNAKLYEGVDVNLGAGKSFVSAETGEETDGTLINAGVTLVPHATLTLNLIYTDTRTERSGGERPPSTDTTRAAEANASFHPVPTIFLFGSYRIEQRTGEDRRSTVNYSATWSPFPDGTLHLNFFFNETLRSEDDARERTITPSLRWNITRRATLDVAYQKLTSDAVSQKSDSEVVSGTFRISF